MMTDVRMPNGDVVRFPDDMPADQIKDLIAKKFPDVVNAPEAETPALQEAAMQPEAGPVEAVARGAAQGATFNLADEIAGGGAQRKTQFDTAMERDRLAKMVAASEAGDWDTYRALQKETYAAGQEAGQERRDEYRARDEQVRQGNPKSFLAGEVLGAVGTGMGAAKGGFSLTANAAKSALPKRIAAGMAEGAAYGSAYGAGGAEEGERLSGAASGGGIGAVAGGAIPVAGAGYRAVKDKAVSAVRSTFRPTSEAQARVASAMARDAGKTALHQGDEAIAATNAQAVMNVDRGGETTRALARASANASPEVRSELTRATSDRFAAQGDRATNLLKRITGGAVDDLALQDAMEQAARKANARSYEQAYKFNFGGTHPIDLDNLLTRVPASAVRNAMKVAKSEGRDFGEQLVASIDDAGDTVTFKRAPSLREWDYIQRGLRNSATQAYRSGAGEVGTAYRNLRNDILGVIDDANPYFKKARAGAAVAFGAEDALEAGRQFAKASRNTPEMSRAIGRMSDAEKKVFQTGFASEMIDKIKSTRDRSNVISSMFGNQEAREKMMLAFGTQKAREIEAFVRIEGAMDMARGMLGNSTTARQLVELGLISGGGATYGSLTGDWKTAGVIAGAGALRYGRAKIDQNVLREIGDILVSGDETKMAQAIAKAGSNSKFFNALKAATDEIYKISPPVVGMGAAALTEE